jgi:hypothetical protein
MYHTLKARHYSGWKASLQHLFGTCRYMKQHAIKMDGKITARTVMSSTLLKWKTRGLDEKIFRCLSDYKANYSPLR